MENKDKDVGFCYIKEKYCKSFNICIAELRNKMQNQLHFIYGDFIKSDTDKLSFLITTIFVEIEKRTKKEFGLPLYNCLCELSNAINSMKDECSKGNGEYLSIAFDGSKNIERILYTLQGLLNIQGQDFQLVMKHLNSKIEKTYLTNKKTEDKEDGNISELTNNFYSEDESLLSLFELDILKIKEAYIRYINQNKS